MVNETGGPAVEPRPTDPAPNRTGRREPVVIDAEAKDLTEPPPESIAGDDGGRGNAAQHEPKADAQRKGTPAPAAAPKQRRWPVLAAGFLGCIVGAAVAGGLIWYFAAQQSGDVAALAAQARSQVADLTARVAKLEARPLPVPAPPPGDNGAALAALDRRLSTAEAGLRNVGETSNAARADAQKALAAAQASPASAAPMAAPPAAPAPAVDLGPLNARVDQIEDQLAALQNGLATAQSDLGALAGRADAGLAASDGASRVVIAGSLLSALDSGAPYGTELAALGTAGVDPAALAALRPFAQKGAPTAATLLARFVSLAPSLTATPAPAASSPQGLLGRLSESARGLVDVQPAATSSGGTPSALVGSVTAALDRGDIAGALTAWAALPPAAQAASQDWAQTAKARLAAGAAAHSILTDAINTLGRSKT